MLFFLATPIFIFDKRVGFLTLAKHFVKWVKKGHRNYDVPPEYNIAYDVFPLKATDSLLALIKYCRDSVVHRIKVPSLLMQAVDEHTVKQESALFIYKTIASQRKFLVWVQGTGHVMTLSRQREDVFRIIQAFLKGV